MERLPTGPDTFFSISSAERGATYYFSVRRSDVGKRLDVNYHRLLETLSSPFPLTQLETLAQTEPSYGLSSRAIERTSENEPRYIRITDFGEDGIEPKHEFVTAYPVESGYELRADDILFARSGATVGKTYIHEDIREPAVFAGYCIRFQFDESKVSPKFVYWWTKTMAYSRWTESIQRPSGQPNINKEEFKSCQIPLPPIEHQDRLVKIMDAARAVRKTKLVEAEAMLDGIDDFVLDALGITTPPEDPRRVFAVRGRVDSSRFDPHFYLPHFAQIKKMLSQTRHETLGDVVKFSKETWKSQCHRKPTFRCIEINAVNPRTGEAHWDEVPIVQTPSRARMKVRTNDIIVSLTRPHRGSIAHLDSKFDGCIASTGFAVIRDVSSYIRRDYLWCILRVQPCLYQMLQRASGGNYPAITESELAKIRVPIPDQKTQLQIAAEVRRRREESRRLRTEAESGWEEAKRWFEGQLLGE